MSARLAGYNSKFYCNDENICNVYCQSSTACYGMFDVIDRRVLWSQLFKGSELLTAVVFDTHLHKSCVHTCLK